MANNDPEYNPVKTVVTYPNIMAIVKAEEILGVNRTWQAANEPQQPFLVEFFEVC